MPKLPNTSGVLDGERYGNNHYAKNRTPNALTELGRFLDCASFAAPHAGPVGACAAKRTTSGTDRHPPRD